MTAVGRSTVVAVVPTYNRKELVAECVKAILGQTASVAQVVVVDNASIDGTKEFLEEQGILENERVDLLRLNVNIGSAGAFRAGMERASTYEPAWIWLADDDAISFPTTLENLLAEAPTRGETNRIALVSNQLQHEGIPITYRLPRNVIDALRYGLGPPYIHVTPGDQGPIPVDWFTFVSVLIPGSAVAAVGLPMEELFYYQDDIEYSLRLLESGYTAFLVPSSLVDHRKPIVGRAKMASWKVYYMYRNTVYVTRTGRHQLSFGKRTAALARITAGAMYWIARNLLKGNVRSAFLTVRGVVDGYRGRLGPTVRSDSPN